MLKGKLKEGVYISLLDKVQVKIKEITDTSDLFLD
tara:strand:+ start:40 stop:144 length:105 start_codon:yes stop_codon:yes gene_type:complete